MSVNGGMPKRVPGVGHQTATKNGSVPGWVQGYLALRTDPRTVDDHIDTVYRCLRESVSMFDKRGNFADEVGTSNGDLSARLNRLVNRGQLQRAFIDWIGVLGMFPAVREVFLRALARAWGWDVQPIAPATAEEMLKRTARELPEHRRREIEEREGWPSGSLG